MMNEKFGARTARWLCSALAVACSIGAASEADAQNPPLGFDQRGNPVIRIPREGPTLGAGDLTLAPAFPQLPAFTDPIELIPVPGAGNLVAVNEKAGRIQIFENRPNVTTKSVFLDIRTKVRQTPSSEQGLLGLAFDPDYATNGFFYVYYTAIATGAANGQAVVSRFQRTSALLANPASERVLLTIPEPAGESNHNGGDIHFGPDDFLYIATGDGGGANDGFNRTPNPHGPMGSSQPLDRLVGKLLRIDPGTGPNAGYQIPPNNPFGGQKCTNGRSMNGSPCGEIFHYGLRNPFRFSFDALTGDGWIGDVGQDARQAAGFEEVDFFASGERGLNFGWPCREGMVIGVPNGQVSTCTNRAQLRDPVTTFPTGEGRSIIGGYVYRGSLFPELRGLYVYSGYTGSPVAIMATDRAGNARRLLSTSASIFGIGQDAQRELYVVKGGNAGLFRFARAAGGGSGMQIPTLLSATGIFASTRDPVLRGAAGVNPYDVRAKLFSDNLDKQRHVAVPANGNITFSANGRWQFPVGSVLVKTFALGEQRIETRVLVRGSDTWRGYTYQWKTDQTDADLVPDAGATIRLSNGQMYDLPSRTDCQSCHNDANSDGSQIIGLQTRQVNFDFAYPSGVTTNQLRTLNGVSYFGRNVGTPAQFDAFPDYADPATGTLNRRAKAYLDQNCGFCHRPSGGTPVEIMLEFDQPLTSLLNRTPMNGPVNGAQRIIDPGSKENSVLWQRMRMVVTDMGPSAAMPPLAHRQVDTVGVQLIGDWIDAMPAAANSE